MTLRARWVWPFLTLVLLSFVVACEDSEVAPVASGPPETEAPPPVAELNPPTPLVEEQKNPLPPPPPPDETFDDCLPSLPAANATACEATLFNPSYCLDFESKDEFAKKNVTATGTVNFSVAGREGNAARPMDGYIGLPLAKLLHLPSGTITFWVAGETEQSLDQFILMDADPQPKNSAWAFRLQRHPNPSVDTLQFYMRDLGPPAANELATLPLDEWSPHEWHQVAVTWDATNKPVLRLYLDGRLRDQLTNAPNFPSAAPLADQKLYLLSSNRKGSDGKIGVAPANGGWRVDTLRAYGTSLQPAQIRQLYQSQLDMTGLALRAGRMEMQLLGPKDGFGLASIIDTADTQPKSTEASSRQLWQIQLRQLGVVHPAIALINNTNALAATLACRRGTTSGTTVLEWKGIPLRRVGSGSETATINVEARLVPVAGDNEVAVRVQVENANPQWTLQAVSTRFGGISAPHEDLKATNLLLPGPTVGSYVNNPFEKEPEDFQMGIYSPPLPLDLGKMILYPSRFFSMQWMGLVDEAHPTGGIYIGAHDGSGTLKALHYRRSGAVDLLGANGDPGLDLAVVSLVDGVGHGGNSHRPEWSAVIGLQDGTWYDVAQRYRRFAQQQVWLKEGPLAQRTNGAPWMQNAGVLQSSASNTAMQLNATAIGQGAPKGLVLWHYTGWQNQNLSFRQNGDMPTATEGPAFAGNLSAAWTAGVPVALYFIPTMWDAVFNGWKKAMTPLVSTANGESWAIRNQSQQIVLDGNDAAYVKPAAATAGTDTLYGVKMCPAAPGWQAVVTNAIGALMKKDAETAKDKRSLKGIYLDVLGTGDPDICYGDPAVHHHALGSSRYHVEGYRAMLTTARAAAKAIDGDAGFYTEGFGEPYIDLIDGHLTVYTAMRRPLPLAMAVYHDYANFIAREVNLDLEQLPMMQAMQGEFFTWGGMPGFANGTGDLTKRTALNNYLIKLGRLRQLFKNYLVLGTMRAPLNVQSLKTTAILPLIDLVAAQSGAPIPVLELPLYDVVALKKMNDNAAAEAAKKSLPPPPPIVQRNVRVPAVATSAWRGPNGKAGIVVTSLESMPRVVYVPIDRSALGLSGTTSKIWHIDIGQAPVLKGSLTSGGVRINLPSQGIVLLEIE